MKILKVLIILIFVMGVGFVFLYNKGDFTWTYNAFNKQIENLQKIDIGATINEIKKEVFMPSPLNIGGQEKDVVLVKSKIISETNRQRKENEGLPALTENNMLYQMALAKANDMFLNQYFEHVSPTGVGPSGLAQKYGYDYIIVGENLILGNFESEQEVVQKWMDSPGHRANILNNRYSEIGVAIIKGKYNGQNVWIGVQEFGLPLSICNQPDISQKETLEAYKLQADLILDQLNEFKKQIENTNIKSSAYRQMIDDYNDLANQYNALGENMKIIMSQYNMQVNNFNNCIAGI
jgi:uncharacterized protein YkwD